MRGRKTAMERGEVDVQQEAKCIIARHGVLHVQSANLEYLLTDLINRIDMTHEERMKIVYIAKGMVSDAGTFEDWADRKNGKPPKPPAAQQEFFEEI